MRFSVAVGSVTLGCPQADEPGIRKHNSIVESQQTIRYDIQWRQILYKYNKYK